jgi:hypothetical protein
MESLETQLVNLEQDISNLRKDLEYHRSMFIHTETKLIQAKIEKENLIEKIRLVKERQVPEEVSARDAEIERFRKIKDEILKKV